MKSKLEQPILGFATAAAFRRWLETNHAAHPGLWMRIAKKNTTIQSITYQEALDEALCYGWIDGQRKAHDATTFLQKFTRRNPRSAWSRLNTCHVGRLTREGRMQPAGQAAVDAAKADGRWAQASDSARDFSIPPDFLAALAPHARARAFFKALNNGNRRAIAQLLATAKRPETRARRLAKFVAMMRRGQKLFIALVLFGSGV